MWKTRSERDETIESNMASEDANVNMYRRTRRSMTPFSLFYPWKASNLDTSNQIHHGCWVRLHGSVDLAISAERSRARHEAAGGDHEVGVGLEVLDVVKLRDDVGHELRDLVIRAERSELGQPDRLAVADLVGLLEVLEEGIGVLGLGVPVDIAEVDLAALAGSLACIHEALEPLQTLTGVATVGDGGSTDESAASIGVHPLNVASGSLLRRDVGLGSMVGLVEAEESLDTLLELGLAVALPVVGVERSITPKHGNIVNAVAEVSTRRGPVVSPCAALA